MPKIIKADSARKLADLFEAEKDLSSSLAVSILHTAIRQAAHTGQYVAKVTLHISPTEAPHLQEMLREAGYEVYADFGHDMTKWSFEVSWRHPWSNRVSEEVKGAD